MRWMIYHGHQLGGWRTRLAHHTCTTFRANFKCPPPPEKTSSNAHTSITYGWEQPLSSASTPAYLDH